MIGGSDRCDFWWEEYARRVYKATMVTSMLVDMALNGQTSSKRFILDKSALYIGIQVSLASEEMRV